MKIGHQEIFSTERTKHQFVTTKFLFIGVPLVPVQSYFVYDKIIEIGSHPIPLNKLNVIKNYSSVVLLAISIFMVFFNFVLNDRVLLSYSINNLFHAQLPLNLIEKVVTAGIVCLTFYVIFFFGKLSHEEKEERLLIQRSEFWNTMLPGKKLIPILGKYYAPKEQFDLMNQLIVLLFRVKIPLPEEEEQQVDAMDIQSKNELFNNKLKKLISSGAYTKCDEQTVALLFHILSLKRRLYGDHGTKDAYLKIKGCLLSKRPALF